MNGTINGHAQSGAFSGVQSTGNAKTPRLHKTGVGQAIVNGVERSNGKKLKMKKTMDGMENQSVPKRQNGLANGLSTGSGVSTDLSGSQRDLTFLKHLTEVIMSEALDKALRPER